MIIKTVLVGNTNVTSATSTDDHSFENISSVSSHQLVMSLNKSSAHTLLVVTSLTFKSYVMLFRLSHNTV